MNANEKIIGEEILEKVSGGEDIKLPDWVVPVGEEVHPNCGGHIVQTSGGYKCEKCGEEHEMLFYFFPIPAEHVQIGVRIYKE